MNTLILKQLSIDHQRCLNQIYDDVEALFELGIPNMPFFTLHNIRHVDRVCQYAFEIHTALHKKVRLNQVELFVLFAACISHDIGMLQQHSGEPAQLIRTRHHYNSYEYIKSRTSRWFDGDNELSNLVAVVAKGHRNLEHDSGNDIDKLEEYNQSIYKGINVRLRLLSAILRIADELDITRDRAPLLLFEQYRELFDSVTLLHWLKHTYVTEVKLSVVSSSSMNILDCRVLCEVPKSKHEDYMEYLIKPHVFRALTSTYEDIKSILNDEGRLSIRFRLNPPKVSTDIFLIDPEYLEIYSILGKKDMHESTMRLAIEYEDRSLLAHAAQALFKLAEFERDIVLQHKYLRLYVHAGNGISDIDKDFARLKLSRISLLLDESHSAAYWLQEIHNKEELKHQIYLEKALIQRHTGDIDGALEFLKLNLSECRDPILLQTSRYEFIKSIAGYLFAQEIDLAEARQLTKKLLKSKVFEKNHSNLIEDLILYRSFIDESLNGPAYALRGLKKTISGNRRLSLQQGILFLKNDNYDAAANKFVDIIKESKQYEDISTEKNARRILQLVRPPDSSPSLARLDPTLDDNKLKLMEMHSRVPEDEQQDLIDYRRALELLSSERYSEAIPAFIKVIKQRALEGNVIGSRVAAHHLCNALLAVEAFNEATTATLYNGNLKTLSKNIRIVKEKHGFNIEPFLKSRISNRIGIQQDRITALMIEETWDIIPDNLMEPVYDFLSFGLNSTDSASSELDVMGGCLDALLAMKDRIPLKRQKQFVALILKNCLKEIRWWTIPKRSLRFIQYIAPAISKQDFITIQRYGNSVLNGPNPHLKSELLWTITAILEKRPSYLSIADSFLNKLDQESKVEDVLEVQYFGCLNVLHKNPSEQKVRDTASKLIYIIKNDHSTKCGQAIGALVNLHKSIPDDLIIDVLQPIVEIGINKQPLTMISRSAFTDLQRFIELGGTASVSDLKLRKNIIKPIMKFIDDNITSTEPRPLSPFNEPAPKELALSAFLPISALAERLTKTEQSRIIKWLQHLAGQGNGQESMVAYIIFLFSRNHFKYLDALHRISVNYCYHNDDFVKSNAIRALAFSTCSVTKSEAEVVPELLLRFSYHEHHAVRANAAFTAHQLSETCPKKINIALVKECLGNLKKDVNYRVRKQASN